MTPVNPRPAGTVVFVRDTPAGVEAYCQQRPTTMAFAAGAWVFPGGAVDPADTDPNLPWHGRGATWWAQRLDLPPSEAMAFVSAALREACEESGVLLAQPTHPPNPTGQVASAQTAAAVQIALLTGANWAETLTCHQLKLRDDLLWPWARWVTPQDRPRRFDTCFFTASVPVGQHPAKHPDVTEATHSTWFRAADLLAAHNTADVHLMPPTHAVLTACAQAPNIDHLLTQVRPMHPVIGPGGPR